MTTNWLDERIKAAKKYYDSSISVTFTDALRKHFSDLDPSKKDAEIAELKMEVSTLGKQVESWQAKALQRCRNEDFYRKEIQRIGELFGNEAKTTDDGELHLDVLALKVYPLVAELRAEVERLKSALAAKPAWPVLREAGDAAQKRNLVYCEQGPMAWFTDGTPIKYRFYDFGPVPPFPPVEPREPKPEPAKVRELQTGKCLWVFPHADGGYIDNQGSFLATSEVEVLG